MPWQESALISSPRQVTSSWNCCERLAVAEQRGGFAVGIAGISAGADLDGLAAGRLDVVQRFLERSLAKSTANTPTFIARPPLPCVTPITVIAAVLPHHRAFWKS